MVYLGSNLDGANVLLFGGQRTNRLAAAIQQHQPFTVAGASPSDDLLEPGWKIGPCTFVGAGLGLVSLGPRPGEKHTGLAVTIAGTDSTGFKNALDSFISRLFETNSWQHQLPDFAVSGRGFHRNKGLAGLRELVAAGRYGDNWEYRDDASYMHC